jgi:lysophospholipase L1-like esterase
MMKSGVCKEYCLRILLLVASVFFVFVVAEWTFRLLIYFKLVEYPKIEWTKIAYQYSDIPELVYEIKPNYIGGMWKSNSLGMRDNEYSLSKPPHTIRFCVLGDSVACGADIPTELNFKNLLEKKLNAVGKGARFEVLNFSVVGYNSFQEEIVLSKKVTLFSPDVVLVGFCLNDDTYTDGLENLRRELSPYSLGSRLHSKLVSSILERLERIVKRNNPPYSLGSRLHSKPVSSILERFERIVKWNNPKQAEHFFRTLHVLGTEKGFRSVVIIFPYYFEKIEKYGEQKKHAHITELAHRYGLEVIDLLDSWKMISAKERKELYRPNDNVHLSSKGMQKVADELFKYFSPLMR